MVSAWRARSARCDTITSRGFRGARHTSGGADGGVDIRGHGVVGQVKYQATAVGRPELQRLVGACGREADLTVMFFTGSSYTKAAHEYAEVMGIALFTYDLAGAMTPVNSPARRIMNTNQGRHGAVVGGLSDRLSELGSFLGSLAAINVVAMCLVAFLVVMLSKVFYGGWFETSPRGHKIILRVGKRGHNPG